MQSGTLAVTYCSNKRHYRLDHYQILCGLSRTELSHGCGIINYGLVRIGREAGTTETMSLSLPVEGVQVRTYLTLEIHTWRISHP